MSDSEVSRRATWIGGLGIAGAAMALAFRRIGDFDLPWHLATGRYVVHDGIPTLDPFSSLHPPVGHIDVVADSVLFGVNAWFGSFGLQVLRALLAAGIGVAIYRFCRRAGPLAWFCVALALAAMSPWLLVRPATFGLLLSALTVLAIDTHSRHPGSRRARIVLGALIPLAAVWANCHGSVALGLTLVGGYALYRIACHVARGRLGGFFPAKDGRDPWVPLAIAAGALAASGLNIAGYGYLAGGQTSDLAGLFAEWQTPTLEFLFVTEPATGLILLATVAALAFGRGDGDRRAPAALDLGLVAVGLFLTFSAVRLIAFASILFAYVIARRLMFVAGAQRRVRIMSLATVLLLGPVFLASPDSRLGIGFEPDHFPSGAVTYIRKAKAVGPVYNFLPFGGYLAWRLYPKLEVFVDGRTSWVYPKQHVIDAVRSDRDDALFAQLDDRFDFQIAIVRTREGENLGRTVHRSSRFKMVYFDEVAAVYVKATGPNARLIPDGYHWFRHQSMPVPMIGEALRGNPDLVHDGALAAQQAPNSARAAFLWACGGIAARDRAVFERARARLVSLAGENHATVQLVDSAWKDVSPDI